MFVSARLTHGLRLSSLLLALTCAAAAQTPAGKLTAPATAPAPAVTQAAKPNAPLPTSLTAAEFAKLSRDLSEEDGFFRSDNFTSNETSYLHIVDKLKQLAAPGGAYLGVGPEQNYTYIAKLRPQIAFLLDIRRQAIIQHLMYKAVFHLAPTRAQFLSRLLSRPLPKEKAPAADAPLDELLTLLDQLPADDQTYAANLALIKKTIQEDFQFPLNELDQQRLEYVYKSFRSDGLEIAYRVEGSWGGSYFPTLKEILAGTDLKGRQGNFLASVSDYEFVRGMHEKHLIIPVVGNFAGPKAIGAVGEYLRQRGATVTAFYLSNVEQYLFGGDDFANFANNVRKLPLTEKSLFIRAITGRIQHPARLPGHRLATILQQMTVFLKDFDAGLYPTYNDLITTHYIMADQP